MKLSRVIRNTLIGMSFAGLATTFGGRSAEAATETAPLTVNATVLTSCTIATAPVNFGPYDPIGAHNVAPLDSITGEVQITCANGLPVNLRLGQGANPAGGSNDDVPLRRMTGPTPADVLAYHLYSDAPGGMVWGNSAVSDVSTVGTGILQTLTIYGRVPGAQNPAAGAYTDTVVAAVDF
jgi:spore coat protein U-like protein